MGWRRIGVALAASIALSASVGRAQTVMRKNDAPGAAAIPALAGVNFWTPSALRIALLDYPLPPDALPHGFGVERMQIRTPSLDERADGMAYRVDVLLSGPFRAQSISFRIYDTVQAARLAALDKTLGDRSVTLTSESADADQTLALADGAHYDCAKVHSASFADVVFLRCHALAPTFPMIIGASVGRTASPAGSGAGAAGPTPVPDDFSAAGALLEAANAQVQKLLANDHDGAKAYGREIMRTAPR